MNLIKLLLTEKDSITYDNIALNASLQLYTSENNYKTAFQIY